MNRVGVNPQLLRWASHRSGRDRDHLLKRFPRLEAWERGDVLPTFRQLEEFARVTYTPIGYLFLTDPPAEELPVTDFRTIGDVEVMRPSPNLLDVLHLCQQRQDWYRDEVHTAGEPPLEFIGSLNTSVDAVSAGNRLRDALNFDVGRRRQMGTWSQALRQFIQQAEDLGILVMVSGVVGSNTRRKLDPKEFRGFALADSLAPLVFINGADARAAQMFTLAHETAHLWLGESGVSNVHAASAPDHTVERWCNEVAAELLMPAELVAAEFNPDADMAGEVGRLARRFRVSTLIALRRIHDMGGMEWEEFRFAYREEAERLRDVQAGGGGNSIRNVGPRVSRRLARSLIISTMEGRTSYTEAFRLLGVRRLSSFESMASSLGIGA